MSFIGDLGLAAVNGGISLLGNKIASDSAKDNLDYQMDRYYSPQAQVRNLAAAGINPAVAFGNQSPVFSGGGQFQIPSNPLAGIGTTSLSDLANYINAKSNEKKAGAETKGTELDNIFKERTMEERIKEVALRNKFTEEETTKVIQEWSKIVGEINILQKDSDIKSIDLASHEKLVNSLIDTYVSRANLDNAQADSLRQQLPIILEKLKSEQDILSVDAEIAKEYKGTMTNLGIVGDAVKIIGTLARIFK